MVKRLFFSARGTKQGGHLVLVPEAGQGHGHRRRDDDGRLISARHAAVFRDLASRPHEVGPVGTGQPVS
jgi:hypothetical protein